MNRRMCRFQNGKDVRVASGEGQIIAVTCHHPQQTDAKVSKPPAGSTRGRLTLAQSTTPHVSTVCSDSRTAHSLQRPADTLKDRFRECMQQNTLCPDAPGQFLRCFFFSSLSPDIESPSLTG